MPKRISNLVALGVFVVLCVASNAEANKEKSKDMKMTPEMQAQMAIIKERGTPGVEHQVLQNFEGQWNVAAKSWMMPDAQPETSFGTSEMKWTLDGRFLKNHFTGDWAGESFHGVGYHGYDKIRKHYVSLWLDSMSTGVFSSTGQYDPKTSTIKDEGGYSCMMTGEKNKWFRSVWKIYNKDKHTYTMYSKTPEGKEFKSMELTYIRK